MGYERGGALIVTPLAPSHLRAIVPQPAQQAVKGAIASYGAALWLTPGSSWTAWSTDMEIVACGGLVPIWPGRAYGWSILSNVASLHFMRLHRAVKELIEQTTYGRIEATVDVDFEAGHRWIELLGFRYEGTMTGFNPNGSDACMYARIR